MAEDNKPRTSYIPPESDPLLGTTLAGRYVIDKKLGEGGMGAVYLATHNLLEKQVALKILHGEFARKPDLVERFMQEAKAASRIRHENVIDISDFGATPEGLVFFAMELLKGRDLHVEIARARVSGHLLPWARTKKIFLQICAALAAAHSKGVIHRDLKPENVYLIEFLGAPDFVKLLDFGIAKLTDGAEGEGGRKLTKTGMLFGTPEYMSPEQARGEQVNLRVDVYAMGCILFQLVTNRVPFEAENFMGVLSMHLTEAPPSIPPVVFEQIGAPYALAAVIDRALEKDRAQRYQTIDELANAVRVACGDALPGEAGAVVQPANVAAPAETIRRAGTPSSPNPLAPLGSHRAPSSPGSSAAFGDTLPEERSGRVKTQWTGTISVPEEAVGGAPKPASKAPLVIGGAVVLAGGAIAAALAFGGGKAATVASAGSNAGSAVVMWSPGSAAGAPIASPVAGSAAGSAAPAMTTLTLDSVPPGATVTDLSTNAPVGKTPCTMTTPRTGTTRQFAFRLPGYVDAIAELALDRDALAYKQPLVKGAGTATAQHVPAAAPHAPDGAVTHPVIAPASDPPKPDLKASDDNMVKLKGFGSDR